MVVTSIKKGANGFGYIAITTTLNMKEHFKVGLHAISKIGVTEQADLIKPVFSCHPTLDRKRVLLFMTRGIG